MPFLSLDGQALQFTSNCLQAATLELKSPPVIMWNHYSLPYFRASSAFAYHASFTLSPQPEQPAQACFSRQSSSATTAQRVAGSKHFSARSSTFSGL